jgi:hypothetical protein
LQLFAAGKFSEALEEYVNKETKESIAQFVQQSVEELQKQLRAEKELRGEDQIKSAVSKITSSRLRGPAQAAPPSPVGAKPSAATRHSKPARDEDEDGLDFPKPASRRKAAAGSKSPTSRRRASQAEEAAAASPGEGVDDGAEGVDDGAEEALKPKKPVAKCVHLVCCSN